MKKLRFLTLLTVCAGSLAAQSTYNSVQSGGNVTQVTRLLGPGDPAVADVPAATTLILNVLTVIGTDVMGVPCFDCVTGAATPNLGLLSPANVIHMGQSYQIDAYLYDVNYTGPCTFTIAVLNQQKQVIVSTNPTFTEGPNSGILLSTALAIPTTTPGVGTVTTNAVCGTSKTASRSPVIIAQPIP
jgi:hypothetical protein